MPRSRYDAMAAALREVEAAVQVVQDPYARRIAFEHLLLAVADRDRERTEYADERVPRSWVPAYLPDADTAVMPRVGHHAYQ